MRVAVIGCGPAGMLVAHAARINGYAPMIFAPERKASGIYGAQYIHSNIPMVGHAPDDPRPVRYVRHGTPAQYAQKIYGDAVPESGTSWARFSNVEMAWSMEWIYHELFGEMIKQIYERTISTEDGSLDKLLQEFDCVMNTAPLPKLAPHGKYTNETVKIRQGRCEQEVELDTIHYYGDSRPAYRSSHLGIYMSTEFPGQVEFPAWRAKHVKAIQKPLRAEVTLPGVYRFGRYGKWRKGVLADEAFQEAMDVFRLRLSPDATGGS